MTEKFFGQKTAGGKQPSENGRQKTAGRKQPSENSRQKNAVRKRPAENGRHKKAAEKEQKKIKTEPAEVDCTGCKRTD